MGLASPPPSGSSISERSFLLQALAALLRTVTDPTAHQYGGLSSAAAPKSLLHDVFHMVFLKKYTGDSPTTTVPLLPIIHGRAVPAPAAVLRARPSSTLWDLLVQWQGHSDAEPPGSRWSSSRSLIQISSLRTSCFLTGREVLWTDSSVTSSSDVTRRRLLLVVRCIYVLFAVIHIIQSLLAWFVRAGSI